MRPEFICAMTKQGVREHDFIGLSRCEREGRFSHALIKFWILLAFFQNQILDSHHNYHRFILAAILPLQEAEEMLSNGQVCCRNVDNLNSDPSFLLAVLH